MIGSNYPPKLFPTSLLLHIDSLESNLFGTSSTSVILMTNDYQWLIITSNTVLQLRDRERSCFHNIMHLYLKFYSTCCSFMICEQAKIHCYHSQKLVVVTTKSEVQSLTPSLSTLSTRKGRSAHISCLLSYLQ